MAYKLIIGHSKGEETRTELKYRKDALSRAERATWPDHGTSLDFAFMGPQGDAYAEVIDGSGARIFDAYIPEGSRYALAWRDSKRTWVRGFGTRDEAVEAKAEVPKGCEAVILNSTQHLPWETKYTVRPRLEDLRDLDGNPLFPDGEVGKSG